MDSYMALVSALERAMAKSAERDKERAGAVKKKVGGFDAWCCQACGHAFGDISHVTAYCPDCGAEMRLER